MANLYGVANAPAYGFSSYDIGAADINCPAGVETNVFDSGLLVAPSAGFFLPIVWATCVISIGATAPANINFNFRLNNGADILTIGAYTGFMIASTTNMYPMSFLGAGSQTLWMAPGSRIQISVNSTGQAVTMRGGGSIATFMLLRAPDQ